MTKHLLTPMKIGTLEIVNRTVVPSMITNFCYHDGTASLRYMNYLEARAKGGWGLIITEACAVEPRGRGFSAMAGLWDDKQIKSHHILTKIIHQYESKIFAQIFHAGRQTSSSIMGMPPVAPSPIPCPNNMEIPYELTILEIHELVEKFGDASLRAKKAGYDGIEIHGTHGSLIAQFLSPYSNKRIDLYGGGLTNRLRFPLEVITNIKEKVGSDFPISFRISGDEFVPGGITIEDTKVIASILETAGIHAIHVSAGVYASMNKITAPAAERHGYLTDLASEVKKVVNIPVITVGRINDPFLAESILSSGKADFIAMGRASLADPDLPNKVANGKFEDIIHCMGCMQGCLKHLMQNKPIKCMVNPALGREIEYTINPADSRKKVLIVGAGPAGMEAAIVAAKEGHEVHLYEKSNRLGGQFYLAGFPPAKGEIIRFLNWQINQLYKYEVVIHLNTTVTSDLIKTQTPDVVIIATGSRPIHPTFLDVNKSIVVNLNDVLSGKVEVAEKVVIIGGGIVGTETAHHLANLGKKVTIIEALPEIARDCEQSTRNFLLKNLYEKNVTIYVNSMVRAILNNGVVVRQRNEEMAIPADTIILAVGSQPNNELASQLEKEAFHVATIGDARNTRNALDSIEEGYSAGIYINYLKELVKN